jgi:hypothetical protein
MALDTTIEPQHALAAIRDLLNRAGIVAGAVAEDSSGGGQVLWEEFIQIHRRRVPGETE